MKNLNLYDKIEEKISLCEKRYEEDKNDSFLSTIRHSEWKTMEILYERVKDAEQPENLLPELEEKLAELEIEKEKEDRYPSFDWYDEHYHYKVLDGQCDAYKYMIKLITDVMNED